MFTCVLTRFQDTGGGFLSRELNRKWVSLERHMEWVLSIPTCTTLPGPLAFGRRMFPKRSKQKT